MNTTAKKESVMITCAFCKGRGVVPEIKGSTKICPECYGSGEDISSDMECLTCHGKGVVLTTQ